MPRVNGLKHKYMANDLGGKIVGLMYRSGITQADIATELGIKQPAVSYKIRNNSFSYEDLLKLFKLFELPDAEIVELMKVR